MAKRTYHDGNGYERKRRKRVTLEVLTIEEYEAYVANRKRESLKKTTDKNRVSLRGGSQVDGSVGAELKKRPRTRTT